MFLNIKNKDSFDVEVTEVSRDGNDSETIIIKDVVLMCRRRECGISYMQLFHRDGHYMEYNLNNYNYYFTIKEEMG